MRVLKPKTHSKAMFSHLVFVDPKRGPFLPYWSNQKRTGFVWFCNHKKIIVLISVSLCICPYMMLEYIKLRSPASPSFHLSVHIY